MQPSKIFILTGAGVSAESGLTTFRDRGGLWTKFPIEEVASIEGYERNPGRVLEFYNLRRAQLSEVSPNAAHEALARLENVWEAGGGQVTIVTQNVDDLHERAGSRRVLHMHGELNKARCHDCGAISAADGDLLLTLGCSACGRIGGLRPHVVWFGEEPLFMEEIFEALSQAELFIAIGTSGAVYPAAAFVGAAREAGIPTLEVNLEPADNASVFDAGRYGPASLVAPQLVDELVAINGNTG